MKRKPFDLPINEGPYRDGVNENVDLLFNPKVSYYHNIADAKSAKRLKDGQIVITMGYYTAGDGGGGSYIFNLSSIAAQDKGSVHTVAKGGRLLLNFQGNGVNPRQFGAKANKTFDDGPALLAACNFIKATFEKIVHTPDLRFAKGAVLMLGEGDYRTTKTLPLFSRMRICGVPGIEVNENSNITVLKYDGPDNTALFEMSQLSYEKAERPWALNDIDIRGVAFSGKNNLTTKFIYDGADAGKQRVSLEFSKIEGCGFRLFKRWDTYWVLMDFHQNYISGVPYGFARIGSSDSRMTKNVLNGGPVIVNGSPINSQSHGNLIEFQGFDNSRFDDNYLTGHNVPGISPTCLKIDNSYETELNGNWFDLSDGPALQIWGSRNLKIKGGRVCHSPLVADMNNPDGSNDWNLYSCGILLANSHDISIDNITLRDVSSVTTVSAINCKNVRITYDLIGAPGSKSTPVPFKITANKTSENVWARRHTSAH